MRRVYRRTRRDRLGNRARGEEVLVWRRHPACALGCPKPARSAGRMSAPHEELHTMKIGFIGLGAMGFPMARHLAKEHEVVVWNRTREKAERHAREHGTTLASQLADCADAEGIITMLPTSREVDEIVDQLITHV